MKDIEEGRLCAILWALWLQCKVMILKRKTMSMDGIVPNLDKGIPLGSLLYLTRWK